MDLRNIILGIWEFPRTVLGLILINLCIWLEIIEIDEYYLDEKKSNKNEK